MLFRSSQPWSLTNVNGTLFFTANDGSTGKELWKTDGTSAGTMLVRDIQPGSDGSSSNSLVNVDGTLLFVANDGSTGEELWQSDGTSSGTVLAMDIATGASSSNPRELREVGGRLFFVATTPDYSTELWTYVEHLPPSDFTLSATSIPENQPSGTAVGTLTTSDPDTGDTFTYTLVPGSGDTNNASFWIDGDTLKTSASFDFEAQSSYSIRMRSSDQRNQWIEETFTITVNNVNEAPTDISLSATSILENQPSGTTVGTLTTAGPDATNICTYTLVPGTGDTDNASFWIDGETLKTAASFDFEAQSTYSIRVRSTDQQNLWVEQTFTITVTNVNEAPTNIALSATLVAENQPSGTAVGTLMTAGPDATNICTYKIGRAHV